MTLGLTAAAMFLASVIGGTTGFATALVATPLLLLAGMEVSQVVVVNLLSTLSTRVTTLIRLRTLVDRRSVALLVAGSTPGAVAGAVTAGWLDQHVLKLGAGVFIALAGLFLLLYRPRNRRSPGAATYAAAGLFSGYLSTSISLSGPPVAALLTHSPRTPDQFIADFAGYFVATNAISIALLSFHGSIPAAVLWPALPLLIAAALAGNHIGTRLGRIIPQQVFQTAVKLLIIVSGVVTALA